MTLYLGALKQKHPLLLNPPAEPAARQTNDAHISRYLLRAAVWFYCLPFVMCFQKTQGELHASASVCMLEPIYIAAQTNPWLSDWPDFAVSCSEISWCNG